VILALLRNFVLWDCGWRWIRIRKNVEFSFFSSFSILWNGGRRWIWENVELASLNRWR